MILNVVMFIRCINDAQSFVSTSISEITVIIIYWQEFNYRVKEEFLLMMEFQTEK